MFSEIRLEVLCFINCEKFSLSLINAGRLRSKISSVLWQQTEAHTHDVEIQVRQLESADNCRKSRNISSMEARREIKRHTYRNEFSISFATTKSKIHKNPSALDMIGSRNTAISKYSKNPEGLHRLLDQQVIDFDELRKNSHDKHGVTKLRAKIEAQFQRKQTWDPPEPWKDSNWITSYAAKMCDCKNQLWSQNLPKILPFETCGSGWIEKTQRLRATDRDEKNFKMCNNFSHFASSRLKGLRRCDLCRVWHRPGWPCSRRHRGSFMEFSSGTRVDIRKRWKKDLRKT